MLMHEMAVAESVLQTIFQYADSMKAKPLRAVISCGQFNALNDDAMQFAFEAAAAGTAAEGVKLVIKHIPLRARCKACQAVFDFDIYNPACRSCESMEFDFEPDAPLLLEDIEFEESQ
jgi:hydrogenase nickel incorporation protein HypA/HybF